MQDTTATHRHYVAIFLISLVTIAVQILVSRIVSVTYYYHFAFAGITFAMLGLTAGALRVYERPERFSAERAGEVLASYCTLFAVCLVAAVLVHVSAPIVLWRWLPQDMVSKDTLILICSTLSAIFLLLAFIKSGVCIALLLTRFPAQSGRLYAFDLCGAALGCIAVIFILMLMSPVSALIAIALVLSLLALWFLPRTAKRSLKWRVQGIVVVLALMCLVQGETSFKGTPAFRLMWMKTQLAWAPGYERWNTYSRVAVWDYNDVKAATWGASEPSDKVIPQKYLNIDASAATIITGFNGDVSVLGHLKKDVINLGYGIRPINSVAVIGVGGGRDILSGLAFGAKRITGIEMNPAIIEGLTGFYGDFSGHLDKQPGVSLVNAEARSYLNSHDDRYDLIQISLIDTWAATAAGGLTLTENKLYTTEAWDDFLNRLNDDGMLVVSRWYMPPKYEAEFHRMVAIAGTVLKKRSPGNPRNHMLAARGGDILALAVSRSPFTAEDIARFHKTCLEHKFKPILTPDFTEDKTALVLATGSASDAFYDKQTLDVTPSTDDKPFFFNMVRFSRYMVSHIWGLEGYEYGHNGLATLSLLVVFGITFAASVSFILWPLVMLYRRQQMRMQDTRLYLLYFACIGLGFMLIEVSQMQRLMIFLGHPVYGLSVVLFTLLLTSGLGSFALQHRLDSGKVNLAHVAKALCLVLVVTGLLTPYATEILKYQDNPVRIVVSALLIAPMGFFMGMMFPVGVALAKDRQAGLLPWYWGVNGAASVLASVSAVILSLQWGISATFWIGVACYGVCLLVVRRIVIKM